MTTKEQEKRFRDAMESIREDLSDISTTTGNTTAYDVDAILALFDTAPSEKPVYAAEALAHILRTLSRRMEDRAFLISMMTEPQIFPRNVLDIILRQESMRSNYRVLSNEIEEMLPPQV